METISFTKYQGTGNDFILIDDRPGKLRTSLTPAIVQQWCDRRFGIGADGLILLLDHPNYDFEMLYFNADGQEGSMCGNGGRCITHFAANLGLFSEKSHFLAVDGPHIASLLPGDTVALKMADTTLGEQGEDYWILNTGSPHYIIFVEDVKDIKVVENGQMIRYSDRFREEGINVNFVEKGAKGLIVATYERGVEDETLSCGTGVTAAALAFFAENKLPGKQQIDIHTKGGDLSVQATCDPTTASFSNIWLIGPAETVFTGQLPLTES